MRKIHLFIYFVLCLGFASCSSEPSKSKVKELTYEYIKDLDMLNGYRLLQNDEKGFRSVDAEVKKLHD